jgi:membrane-anchored protein YejM (alkaline phosphatase superfamily)
MWNPLQLLRRSSYTENFVLATFDSCRYDAYEAAQTPVLDSYLRMKQAYSQATYTYASHASMFQGMLPHVFESEDYYNRFNRQLWRLAHRKAGQEPRVSFPKGSRSIIDGFNRLGYFTCGIAAMAWFKNNWFLRQHWQAFKWTGIAGRLQVEWTLEQVKKHSNRPFFAFINFGETHSPFRYDIDPGSEGDAAARKSSRKGARSSEDWTFDEEKWRAQVECLEFLDARIGDLLDGFAALGKDVTLVVCGDHGECFGEEGLYGHGFYHPKVMEVPMGIFEFRAAEPRHRHASAASSDQRELAGASR